MTDEEIELKRISEGIDRILREEANNKQTEIKILLLGKFKSITCYLSMYIS